jgi:hypothetical protein
MASKLFPLCHCCPSPPLHRRSFDPPSPSSSRAGSHDPPPILFLISRRLLWS